MVDLSRSPGPVNQVGRSQIHTLKIFCMEIPLPPWAVSAIAVVGIIAVTVTLALAIIHYRYDLIANKTITKQGKELQAQREELKKWEESLRLQQFGFQHAIRHSAEVDRTNFLKNPRFKLLVRFYDSDNCMLVVREPEQGSGDPPVVNWFPNPKNSSPPTGKLELGKSRTSLEPGQRMLRSESPALAQALVQPISFSTASVRLNGQMALAQPASPCRGQCQNSHPGRFDSWQGERRGCWVQVWRKWPDGCTHYQWFNTCNSYWDSDERGQPRLNWTCCNH